MASLRTEVDAESGDESSSGPPTRKLASAERGILRSEDNLKRLRRPFSLFPSLKTFSELVVSIKLILLSTFLFRFSLYWRICFAFVLDDILLDLPLFSDQTVHQGLCLKLLNLGEKNFAKSCLSDFE